MVKQEARQANEHMYADYIKTYGKKSVPRHELPSMFEYLQFNPQEAEVADFKATKEALRTMDDYRRYKALIDRAHDGYTTESRDNYKKFQYQRIDEPVAKIAFQDHDRPSHDKSLGRPKSAPRADRTNFHEDGSTEYQDKISLKFDEHRYRDVKNMIDQNDQERHAANGRSQSRDRKGYQGNYKRSDLLDFPDTEDLRKKRQEEKEQIEAAEQAR